MIKNPGRIYTGQQLLIHLMEEKETETEEIEGEVYIIRSGDSLWKVAQRIYGDGKLAVTAGIIRIASVIISFRGIAVGISDSIILSGTLQYPVCILRAEFHAQRVCSHTQIYPATGEIYGMPMEAGEFRVKVRADYSNPAYLPSYAELTLIVLDNTDDNVGIATDGSSGTSVPSGSVQVQPSTIGNSTGTCMS